MILLRVLYHSVGIDSLSQQFGSPHLLHTGEEVATYLQSIRLHLRRIEPEASIRFVLVFRVCPLLGEMLGAARAFREMHLADMNGKAPRIRLDEERGRHILLLDDGEAEEPGIMQQLADQFGGVYGAPLGRGGVLRTKIGGLVTVSCGVGEQTVSGEFFQNFLLGTTPLPAGSGVRVRTRSGRLARQEAEERSNAFKSDPPTKPALRSPVASLPPPASEPTEESVRTVLPRDDEDDDAPEIEVVGDAPTAHLSTATMHAITVETAQPLPPPAPSARRRHSPPRGHRIGLRDLPLDPNARHVPMPPKRAHLVPPRPPVPPRHALRPPPPKDDSDPDPSKGRP